MENGEMQPDLLKYQEKSRSKNIQYVFCKLLLSKVFKFIGEICIFL